MFGSLALSAQFPHYAPEICIRNSLRDNGDSSMHFGVRFGCLKWWCLAVRIRCPFWCRFWVPFWCSECVPDLDQFSVSISGSTSGWISRARIGARSGCPNRQKSDVVFKKVSNHFAGSCASIFPEGVHQQWQKAFQILVAKCGA